jgi:hypothetical protein
LKNLRKYLDLWEDGKTVRGLYVTLEDIRTLQDAYNAIIENRAFCFLSANVKKVFDKCGIATVEHDVGWMIERSNHER